MFLSVKIPMEVTDCSTTIKDSDANDSCLDEMELAHRQQA
jgi:hypothetical protein